MKKVKKVKIIETNNSIQLEEEINKYLDKDWQLKGDIIKGDSCFLITMCKY